MPTPPFAYLSQPALVALALSFTAACAPPLPRANLVGDRVLIQAQAGRDVQSLDAKSGQRVASFGFEGWADGLDSSGKLVFVHGAGGLAARDVDSGEVRWRVMMKLGYAWRAEAGGSLVFAPVWRDKDSTWIAFDGATGSRRFELSTDRWAPLQANGDVIVTIDDDTLVAYDATDGKARWRSEIEVRSPLLLAGSRLFVRLDDDRLGVFTASSGALQRRIDPGGTGPFRGFRGTHPRLAANAKLVGWIQDDVLSVADAGSGKVSWTKSDAELLAMSDTVVVTTVGDQVLGLDPATGSQKWRFNADEEPESVVARGDTVAVRAGELVVLDAQSGKKRFSVAP